MVPSWPRVRRPGPRGPDEFSPTGGRVRRAARTYLPNHGVAARFDAPEQAEFPHGQRRTVDSLLDALATRAGVLVMSEQERKAILSRIGAFLADRPETTGEFDVPMLTGVLRVRS